MRNLKEFLITFLLYLMRKRPRFKYEIRHHLQAFDQQYQLPSLDYLKNVLKLKKKTVKRFKLNEKWQPIPYKNINLKS
jgi:ribosomal protein S18